LARKTAGSGQKKLALLPLNGQNPRPLAPAIDSNSNMKQDIHPEYRDVVFQDISSEFAILTRSTVPTRETIKWEDGKEYPLLKLEISSQSHPFYTGKQHILQTAKQVDKFRQRYGK
jgi:large subunit ribosomal protein L31